jgi:hypothetical protein
MTTLNVDAESESGDAVVIVTSDPGETIGMTRERAYFLTKTLTSENWKVANSASRVEIWTSTVGCEYSPEVTLAVNKFK